MKHNLLTVLISLSLLLSGHCGLAAETNNASTELRVLVMKVNSKLKVGKDTEKDLSDELKEFDTLFAKYQDQKTDDVAQILYMKANLYLQVLDNTDKAMTLIKQIQNDFAGTKTALAADRIVESMKQQQEAKKVSGALVQGATFPDFNEQDLAGKPLSIANYRGKVVLIDFWATWCAPCVAELPNVIKTYEKYHPDGLEIIGISLDQDETRLKTFIQQRNLTWQQFFDGKGGENKLATKYGVTSIPTTYLLDGNGKIIAKNLRGENLEHAVANALAKK